MTKRFEDRVVLVTGGGGGRPPGLQWRLVIGSSMVNEQLSGCTAAPTGSLEPAVALELPLQTLPAFQRS